MFCPCGGVAGIMHNTIMAARRAELSRFLVQGWVSCAHYLLSSCWEDFRTHKILTTTHACICPL